MGIVALLCTLFPHHRQSVSDGVAEPVPGLLAGGPNPGRQDGVHYAFTEPETAYTDESEAYASNEIAINWNAPLAYLLGAIESIQKESPIMVKVSRQFLLLHPKLCNTVSIFW